MRKKAAAPAERHVHLPQGSHDAHPEIERPKPRQRGLEVVVLVVPIAALPTGFLKWLDRRPGDRAIAAGAAARSAQVA